VAEEASAAGAPQPGLWARALAVDPRGLGALRVGLGLLLLYDLATRFADLTDHYSDLGVLPVAQVPAPDLGSGYLSLHLLSGSVGWQLLLFGVAAGFALALLVGRWTPWATLGSFLLLGSLHARNPLVCYEADALLALLLLWFGLSAAGRAPPGRISWPRAALVLQVCFVYLFAFLSKTGPTWWDGSAVAYALHVDQYATPLGVWLRGWSGLCAALTWGTLAVEAAAPLLLVCPWWSERARLAGVGLLAGLQVGFFLCMDLGIFPVVSLLALVPLLPPSVWDRLGPRTDRLGEGPWEQRAAPPWVGRLAATLILVGLAWNVAVLGRWTEAVPRPLSEVCRALRLDQSWRMFAPDPMVRDGWFVVSARLEDESLVDLLREGAPLDWARPERFGLGLSDRWKEWLMTGREKPGHWPATARFLAWRWNRDAPAERALVSLSVVYVEEVTLPGGQAAPPRRVYLWTGRPRGR
jgi:hypothetical protein